MSAKKEALVPEIVNPHQSQFNQLEESRCQSIIKLLEEMKADAKDSLELARNVLINALEIGKLLTEQKKELKQGEFGPWVNENLPFKHRTANRYMELYRDRDKLNFDKVKSVTQAYRCLKMITANATSTPSEDSDEKIKIIISALPEEAEPIMTALNRVKQLLDTESMTRAIYTLASDWLEANDDKTVLPPLEDKIHLLEQTYKVKLVVQSNV
jgi:hypothetical protein